MKSLFVLISSLVLSSSLLAQSNRSLSDKAARVAEALQGVEDQLSPQDRKYIKDSLNLSLEILSNYTDVSGDLPGNGGNGSRNFICVSNGQSGVWERFSIYNSKSGSKLGGETSYEHCGTLIKKSTRNLICVSNGQTGVWEKFQLINRANNSQIGGETTLENCLETIH